MDLITRPGKAAKFSRPTTGAQRAAARLAAHRAAAGEPQPTPETRQNRRFFELKAAKQVDRKDWAKVAGRRG